jgi:hypothetical protein
MLNQVLAKIFQGLDGMLAGQGVNGIAHRIGWEDFAVISLRMRRVKVALKTNRQAHLTDVVTALLLGHTQQVNL